MTTLNTTRKATGETTCLASADRKGHLPQGDQLAGLHQWSWKAAISRLTRPAFRLHQYRNVHTRMLQDALSTRDHKC